MCHKSHNVCHRDAIFDRFFCKVLITLRPSFRGLVNVYIKYDTVHFIKLLYIKNFLHKLNKIDSLF